MGVVVKSIIHLLTVFSWALSYIVRSLSPNLVLFCDRAEQSMKIGMMFLHGILKIQKGCHCRTLFPSKIETVLLFHFIKILGCHIPLRAWIGASVSSVVKLEQEMT